VSAPAQPRVPAGQEGGGRFASAECPTTYRLLAALRPVEEPRRVPANWGSPAEPIIRQVPESSVPASTVGICCPGCVYDSPEYAAAVVYWKERDARSRVRGEG
jgi:hypothetical protein